MVTRSIASAVVVIGALALVTTSCASVWGFEPLSGAEAADGGEEGGGGAGDATIEGATTTADSGCQDANGCTPSCGDHCDAGPAVDAMSNLSCQGSGGSCACGAAAIGVAAPCSPASLGVDAANVLCCADPNFPANGSCRCEWIGCSTSNGNCICGPQYNQPGGSCAPQPWTCCLQNSAPQCVCSTLACQTGFTTFGNACGPPDVTCSGVQRKVAACH